MKRFWITAAVAAFTLAQAQARIGESEAQIEARYGKPVQSKEETGYSARAYRSAGMVIVVRFGKTSRKSEYEQFKKAAKEQGFSDKEVGIILSVNANGRSWKLVDDPDVEWKQWVLDDGSMIAMQQLLSNYVIVAAKAYAVTSAKISDDAAAETLKGL